MCNYIQEILQIQKNAMSYYGKSYIKDANAIDQKINKCDDHIEELAMIVLATRQPLAIDLRFVLSSIKLAVIMERIGDLCKNIIRRSANIKTKFVKEIFEDIKYMNNILISMMDGIELVFKKNKEIDALKVLEKDTKVDLLYSKLIDKISIIEIDDKVAMSDIVQILMVCKNIERIGDYIVKLAKILYYIKTGKKI
jgi:phosphate transport system protein